ncbi:MAG: cysteine desulfurase [Alphaproteobacteria bacterium]|nr:cysteine desulfurase [Alphaproteobacteria bacterium]
MKNKIYFDYNATVPLRPQAREAMREALGGPLNASSVHGFGREGRKLVERARTQVAALVNAPPAQVIFNSGATEGNNTVLKYFSAERVLVSAIEHPSVLEAVPEALRIPVTRDGVLDLGALETLLKQERTGLVSVMLVNNETGVIQPVAEAAALAKRHGAFFHCDAVQAAGKVPLDIVALGIDFMTISAHKIGGPQGAGALVLGLCGITPVLLHGGGQEKSARAGTENVAAIAGFGAAAQAAGEGLADESKRLESLRGKLETALQEILIHGKNAPRAPNTTLFSLPGIKAETMLMALDLEGIAVSNGSACSSGTVKPSAVLKAMGYGDDIAGAALRISTGWATTEEEIDGFLDSFMKIKNRMQGKRNAHA